MPWISLGNIKASRIYRGTSPVTHVYRGSELIWKLGYGSTFTAVAPPVLGTGWDFTQGLSSDAPITRSGVAWRWNSSRVLTSTATDIGRIDYDPETGTLLGLLVEPAATNLLLWSRRLAQGVGGAAWVTSGISVSDNVVGLDGGSNKASTLTATTAMATLLSPKTATISDYIFSAWVKRKIGYGAIDVTVDGGTTWVEMTAQILGGQWVRIGTHLLGVNPFLANPSCGFRFRELGDQLEVDLCQLEAGPEATSEIITEGSAVTRNAETLRAINIPDIGSTHTFAWPAAAVVRGARWLKSLSFTNVVANTSADMTVTYVTSEPGKPVYYQIVPVIVAGYPNSATITVSGFAPTVYTEISVQVLVSPTGAAIRSPTGTSVFVSSAVTTPLVPATAAVQILGWSAVIVATDHQSMLPASGAITASGFAPSVAGSAWVYPDLAAIVASGHVPTVAVAPQWIYPDAAAISASGFAPTIDGSAWIYPDTAPIAAAGHIPTAAVDPQWIAPDSTTLSSSGLEPTVTTI